MSHQVTESGLDCRDCSHPPVDMPHQPCGELDRMSAHQIKEYWHGANPNADSSGCAQMKGSEHFMMVSANTNHPLPEGIGMGK